MAPTPNRQPAPILPPSTPLNSRPQPQNVNQLRDGATVTPTTENRMNPPPLPRPLMTPAREMRESSVASSGGSARKPRQNLEERDHVLMLKHCHEQRHNYKEGTKAQFWTGVNTAFQQDTGKVLAQMSATVARLVEARRRQIADWENGVIPQKPGGELNESLDRWMEFLRTEDSEAEAERMRQVEARRRLEEARKEARRASMAADTISSSQPQIRPAVTSQAPTADMGQGSQDGGEMVPANGQADINGYNPRKRKRQTERQQARELQSQMQQQQQQEAAWVYAQQHPIEPPKRVIVEGALTKEDWMEIIGSDARLRALENKVERIELICSQNNKLLLQLMQNQNSKDRSEEERVPVHLDAEFERDYL
ncbi:hypothetical protein OIDMADRAFT_37369 [Oidiodendron maius Zn]|uniref:Uncharacterized protein n=1 Tax=Oidiodendron maius (strain Zn) TaxID=913774 RepID=A0A0C3HZ10_OIDMZ|nr:hypothetical protein OIDMADRAFT_37369 [Oidiodendron maius Zn]